MNKKVIIAGAVMLLFVVLLVYLFSGEDTPGVSRKAFVSDKWDKEFLPDDKHPLGTALFREMVESHCDSAVFINDSLEDHLGDTLSTYIFTGDKFSLYQNEFDSLLKQVEKGSNLFLSFHELSNNIHNQFFSSIYFDWHFEEKVIVHSSEQQKSFALYSIFQSDTTARVWKLIPPSIIVDSNFMTLSYVMETPNFIRLKKGKGTIFLHTNPEMFFNYQLLTKDGFNHADFVISHIPESHTVKWLELGRMDADSGPDMLVEEEGNEGKKDDSLLKFIFEKKGLMIAFLITILGLILYLIFRTKRYWPVVPFIPPSENKSLDFADTMTSIYKAQQSPYSVLLVMRANFRTMVNKQFFIDIAKNEKAVQLLTEKSGLEREQLERLVSMMENQRMQNVSHQYIEEVAKLQREFYLKTGIIKQKIYEKVEKKKIEFKRGILISSIFILAGILFFLAGSLRLSMHNGVGAILLLLGIFQITAGAILMNGSFLVVDDNKLIYYPNAIRKEIYEVSEILGAVVSGGQTTIEFTGNRKIRINHFAMSKYSRADFQIFIGPYLK